MTTGDLISPCRFVATIGEGGMGEVFLRRSAARI
jgi:hypothetical protein